MNVYIKKIRYYKEKTSFGVYEVSSPSFREPFVSIHLGKPLQVGNRYRVEGNWEVYQKEKQFLVQEVHKADPDSLVGLFEVLTDPAQFAFPKDIASRIVKQYGLESLSLIREDPTALLDVPGIPKYRIAFLEERYSKKRPLKEFESYLKKAKIPAKMIQRILKKVDEQILSLVEHNPYLLCRYDASFFSVCETLRPESFLSLESSERMEGALHSVLLQNETQGNLRISMKKALRKTEELLGYSISSFCNLLSNQSFITLEENNLYLSRSFLQMKEVAKKCKELLQGFSSPFSKEEVLSAIRETENELGFALSSEQKEAIFVSEQSGISLIVGKPGSGKTTVIRGILLVLEKLYGDSLKPVLGAPTGIAAWRMSTAAKKKEAFTLHKLLGLFPGDESVSSDSFEENLFLIDELSMVDLSLFSMFIQKVPIGGRLILLGDTNQLSSIGAGDVLKDLRNSPIPFVELQKVYRQSATDSSILHNASLLLENQSDFAFGDDFAFFPAESFPKALDTILRLFLTKSKLYGLSEVKILCPYREWVDKLNEKIAENINPPMAGKREVRIGQQIFREGDLVLETKNQTIGHSAKTKVNNGDIGTLFKIENTSEKTMLHISFPENRKTIYSLEEVVSLKHAYALTIHKSQGSEYSCVLMCILDAWNDPSEGRMLSKALLYTAITRAKKQFYWVGSMDILPQIFEKNENTRNTGLSGFIRKEVEQ